jgi:glycerol-3-phosphate dehydrogenase
MAYTVDDFLVRRTEIYYTAADQGLSVAPIVADLMAQVRGWDDKEKARQLDAYRETVALSRRYLE